MATHFHWQCLLVGFFQITFAAMAIAQQPDQSACERTAHERARQYNARVAGQEFLNWTNQLNRAKQILFHLNNAFARITPAERENIRGAISPTGALPAMMDNAINNIRTRLGALSRPGDVHVEVHEFAHAAVTYSDNLYHFNLDRFPTAGELHAQRQQQLQSFAPFVPQQFRTINIQRVPLILPTLRAENQRAYISDAIEDDRTDATTAATAYLAEYRRSHTEPFDLDTTLSDICYHTRDVDVGDPGYAAHCDMILNNVHDLNRERFIAYRAARNNVVRIIANNILEQRRDLIPAAVHMPEANFWHQQAQAQHFQDLLDHLPESTDTYIIERRARELTDHQARLANIEHTREVYRDRLPSLQICTRNTVAPSTQRTNTCYDILMRDLVSRPLPTLTAILARIPDSQRTLERRRQYIAQGLAAAHCPALPASSLDNLTNIDLNLVPAGEDPSYVGDLRHMPFNQTARPPTHIGAGAD